MLHFDEEELKGTLTHLATTRISAFAASCAGRLARDVNQFQPGSESDQVLAEAGLTLWEGIRSGRMFDTQQLEARLMEVMPDELDDGDFTAAVVEDATASMIYAMRSRSSDNVQNAAWAARRVYETADRYASGSVNEFEYGESAEAQILQNPVVQLELTRQARDIGLLRSDRSDAEVFAALQANMNRERVLEQKATTG